MEDDDVRASAFAVLSEQTTAEILHICWCPIMDLVAVIYETDIVEIRRLSWEELCRFEVDGYGVCDEYDENGMVITQPNPCSVTSVAWRPDGKVLAIGLKDGVVQLYCVRTQIKILESTNHTETIQSMHWAALSSDIEKQMHKQEEPWHNESGLSQYTDRTKYMFNPLPDVPSSGASVYALSSGINNSYSSNTTEQSNCAYDADCQKELNVLVCGDANGKITMSAFGTWQIIEFNVFQDNNNDEKHVINISHVKLTPDLQYIMITFSITDNNKIIHEHVITYRLKILLKRCMEIKLLTSYKQHINKLFHFLGETMAFVKSKWNTIYGSVYRKFDYFETFVQDFSQPSSLDDELTMLLLTGIPTAALHQYINRFLSAQKLMQTRTDLITQCDRLIYIIQRHMKRCVEEIVFRLSDMRGLVKWRERYEILGFETALISVLVELSGSLLLKIEKFHRLVIYTKEKYKVFLEWMVAMVDKFTVEAADTENEPKLEIKLGDINVNEIGKCITDHVTRDIVGSFCFSPNDVEEIFVKGMLSSPLVELAWNEKHSSLDTHIKSLEKSCNSFFDLPKTHLSKETIIFVSPISILPNISASIESKMIANNYISMHTSQNQNQQHTFIAFRPKESAISGNICTICLGKWSLPSGTSDDNDYNFNTLKLMIPCPYQNKSLFCTRFEFYNDTQLLVLLRFEPNAKNLTTTTTSSDDEPRFGSFLLMIDYADIIDMNPSNEIASSNYHDIFSSLVPSLENNTNVVWYTTSGECVQATVRSRIIPNFLAADFDVNGKRGMLGIIGVGSQRLMILDLEDDEQGDEEDDEMDDE